jgi:hypothetical protein
VWLLAMLSKAQRIARDPEFDGEHLSALGKGFLELRCGACGMTFSSLKGKFVRQHCFGSQKADARALHYALPLQEQQGLRHRKNALALTNRNNAKTRLLQRKGVMQSTCVRFLRTKAVLANTRSADCQQGKADELWRRRRAKMKIQS